MTVYAEVVIGTDIVSQVVGLPDAGGVGPPAPCPIQNPGCAYYLMDEMPDWSTPPSTTHALKWNGGEPHWVETVPLADVVARAIDQIDSSADAARMAVIAKQTNTPEYQRAEAQARAFKAAGYPAGDVPRNVAGWVAAKWRDEMTAQQAADDIIVTADRWYELLDDIRDMRLAAKEDVRHAADAVEVAARARLLEADLYTLMVGVE